MQLTISRTELARVVGAVGKVIEARNTIPILSNILMDASGNTVRVTGTDLDIQATATADATVTASGKITVSAKLLGDIVRKAGADQISLDLKDGRLTVKSGRSRFVLETLPATDYPDLAVGTYTAEFEIDLAALFAPVAFAISTEETRYYLNGVFFKGGAESVAVSTDGHRLARNRGPELPDFAGIIVPRKTVGLLPKGVAKVAVSESKIRIEIGDFVMVSKLIDGTFPDYERVIPKGNDKAIIVDRDQMMKAADRVTSVSTERGRTVKLSVAPGAVSLSARSDVGEAEDEVEAEYSGEPFQIGFNSAYVRDIFAVLPAGQVTILAADAGSPAVITGGKEGLTLVLMPVRL